MTQRQENSNPTGRQTNYLNSPLTKEVVWIQIKTTGNYHYKKKSQHQCCQVCRTIVYNNGTATLKNIGKKFGSFYTVKYILLHDIAIPL